MGFGFSSLGFGVWNLGFRVWGLGSEVSILEIWGSGPGFRAQECLQGGFHECEAQHLKRLRALDFDF